MHRAGFCAAFGGWNNCKVMGTKKSGWTSQDIRGCSLAFPVFADTLLSPCFTQSSQLQCVFTAVANWTSVLSGSASTRCSGGYSFLEKESYRNKFIAQQAHEECQLLGIQKGSCSLHSIRHVCTVWAECLARALFQVSFSLVEMAGT